MKNKQVSLNDEIFFLERQKEKNKIKEKIGRQISFPEEATSMDKIFCTSNQKLGPLLESQEKDWETTKHDEESQSNQGSKFKVSLSKMLTGLKSDPEAEAKGAVEELKSFTQKRGINIDPINMFWIHRQKDQTNASKCGILHKYVYIFE